MAPTTAQDPPSNVTERRQPVKKRKRETPSASSTKTSTPNAYARRSPPREPAPAPIDNDSDKEASKSPARKLKRPGAGARIGAADREAAEVTRRKRAEEERKAVNNRQTTAAELVAEHYNAVPERGREWRKTDSQIKGLRSLNNWVKSTLIQKFSRPEVPVQGLTVLDMACGKGGDLGKWEKAPQVPALYVGCDIADISVQQARERYAETMRRNQGRHRRPTQMRAEFYVHDSFGKSLADLPMVRQVGFNPTAGPGSGLIQPGMPSGGFDVVSMMFALHYSFESEVLARGMLKNVAGALKKGGRFIGVMPNSDVISATVKKLLQAETMGKTPNPNAADGEVKGGRSEEGQVEEEDDDWDPEKPSEANGAATADDAADDEDWDPEKPSAPQPQNTNGTQDEEQDDEENRDPGKSSDQPAPQLDPPPPNDNTPAPPPSSTTPAPAAETTPLPPLEWGNNIYTIRFPHNQPLTHLPLPQDGIFRPPYGWRYHYQLAEAVDNVPEYVVPWEGFRALAEDYGLELLYRKGFREVLDEIWEAGDEEGRGLAMLAERMGVLSRDRSAGRGGLLVGEEEMEAAGFYLAFCFYRI